MIKILVLGANGMLGCELMKHFSDTESIEAVGAARCNADWELNLLDDGELKHCFSQVSPDIVINAAANTSIEDCEERKGEAYLINARLPSVVAGLCREYGAYNVHISTDHFFCGDGRKKHSEEDSVVLVNEYARSKYAGESLALSYNDTVVLRTNIVGFKESGQRRTFLEWVVWTLLHEELIDAYEDFYTSSIHITDFSRILEKVIEVHPLGIFNVASSEVSSKKEFITAVSETVFGRIPVCVSKSVKVCSTVKRADSLGLDTAKAESVLGIRMPSLKETAVSIKKEYERRNRYAVPFFRHN